MYFEKRNMTQDEWIRHYNEQSRDPFNEELFIRSDDDIINQMGSDIQKIVKAMGGTMVYGCIDKNMPEYAHEAVQWCMDKGIVSGVDAGNLNLNDDKLWVCCTVYRLAQYLAKLMGCKV